MPMKRPGCARQCWATSSLLIITPDGPHHERIGVFRIFGRDAGFTALYSAYATSIRCVIPEHKVNLEKLIQLLLDDKRTNPSNYALVVLSEGATWDDYAVQERGDPDAYGHRGKANVAEVLADEIRRRTGEETITSDLTYDLRSGDPDFIDKLVALTFGNMGDALFRPVFLNPDFAVLQTEVEEGTADPRFAAPADAHYHVCF